MINQEENGTKDILDKTIIVFTSKRKEIRIAQKKKTLILVDGTTDFYYSENTSEKSFVDDITIRKYLMNNISNDLSIKIDFISSIAYEIFKLIATLNQLSRSKKIEEIKEELIKLKYDPDNDFKIKKEIPIMNCGRFDHFSDERKSNNNYYNNNKTGHLKADLKEELYMEIPQIIGQDLLGIKEINKIIEEIIDIGYSASAVEVETQYWSLENQLVGKLSIFIKNLEVDFRVVLLSVFNICIDFNNRFSGYFVDIKYQIEHVHIAKYNRLPTAL
ncbi:hypothetical protein H8356DRAFT_1321409 [Neocallimastix lanati (nom. inval.)]|nr:hypothetical protein H8356DRAFT_1321409 [Neocallimastix sp. JGI-2020a]